MEKTILAGAADLLFLKNYEELKPRLSIRLNNPTHQPVLIRW